MLIDRVGGRGGTFVSPAGTPLELRALPPGAAGKPLETYEIIRPIPEALSGPVAPWFGQPGRGIQFQLPASVGWLIENGYLRVKK